MELFPLCIPPMSPRTRCSDPWVGSGINTFGPRSKLDPSSRVSRGKGLTPLGCGFLICKQKLRAQSSWGCGGFGGPVCTSLSLCAVAGWWLCPPQSPAGCSLDACECKHPVLF